MKKEGDEILGDTLRFIRNKNPSPSSNHGSKHSKHIQEMNRRLSEHKRLAVENLLISRQLEQSIRDQLKSDEEANQRLLLELSVTDNKVKKFSGDNSGDLRLRTIENILSSRHGTAHIIQKSLQQYNDMKLRQELSSLPNQVKDSMNANIFIKIALMTSGGRVSAAEALQLYKIWECSPIHIQTSSHLQLHPHDDSISFTTIRWNFLTDLLLKKTQNLFLIQEVHSNLNSSASSSLLIPATSPTLTSTSRIFSPQSSLLNKLKRPNSTSNSNTISKPRKKTPSSTSTSTDYYTNLTLQYTKSQEIQKNYSMKMMSKLSQVSQSMTLGGGNQHQHTSAKTFAKHMGARKVEVILQNKIKKLLELSFHKWQHLIQWYKIENDVKKTVQFIAVFKLLDVLEHNARNKKGRYFKYFRKQTSVLSQLEEFSAVIEIQRIIRSFIAKNTMKRMRRIAAAIVIQKTARGWSACKKTKALIHARSLNTAVISIQMAWRANRMRRSAMKIMTMISRQKKAIRIQKTYRGFYARKHRNKLRLDILTRRGALKMQCQWRRYVAICRADKMRINNQMTSQLIKIQKTARGFIGRLHVKDLREMYKYSTRIQSCYRCHLARKELLHRQRTAAAIRIQRIIRSFLARKHVRNLRLKCQQIAQWRLHCIQEICRIILGYIDRKRYARMLSQHYKILSKWVKSIQRRFRLHALGQQAKAKIQAVRKERQRVAIRNRQVRVLQRSYRAYLHRKELRRLQELRIFKAAVTIQRHVRGRMGREYVKTVRIAYEERMARNKVPMYYRLQQQYLRDQNLFHRGKIMIIQCAYRSYTARVVVEQRRRLRAARKIQKWFRRISSTKPYVRMLRAMKHKRLRQIQASVQVQRIVRGHIGRAIAKRHYKAEIVKWFAQKFRLYKIASGAVNQFKLRKRKQRRAVAAVRTLQAHFRGWQTRQRISKQYHKLVKQRDRRRLKRKWIAAIKIQSVIRMKLANSVVKLRRVEVTKARKRKEMKDRLEARIDSIHEEHLKNVQITQIQNVGRQKLARNKVAALATETEIEAQRLAQKALDDAATKIQALARGAAGRNRFRKLQPLLRRAKQVRLLCAECERSPATKLCRNCRDKFCEDCYVKVHKKGQRKKHDWTYVPDYYPVVRTMASVAPTNVGYAGINLAANKATRSIASTKKQSGRSRMIEMAWETFHDENSSTTYYHNAITGETTWTKPATMK
eukprot:gene6616-13401_t